jgi:predicted AAA+ superfamily ATPase
VFPLGPYFFDAGKRLVKTPKLYFNDTGTAAHLSGLDTWTMIEKHAAAGPMLETWVAAELCKILPLIDHRLNLYFWRTQDGQEVDFLIERGDRLVAIEVKWASRLKDADVRGLDRCAENLKSKLHFSMVLYPGNEVAPLSASSVVLPMSIFMKITS